MLLLFHLQLPAGIPHTSTNSSKRIYKHNAISYASTFLAIFAGTGLTALANDHAVMATSVGPVTGVITRHLPRKPFGFVYGGHRHDLDHRAMGCSSKREALARCGGLRWIYDIF